MSLLSTYIFASVTSFLFYSFTRRFAARWMVWGQGSTQCLSGWLSRAKTAVKNHSWFLNDLLKTASSKFCSLPREPQHPRSAQQVAFPLFSVSVPLGSVLKCWSLISLADLLLPICQPSFVYRQCIYIWSNTLGRSALQWEAEIVRKAGVLVGPRTWTLKSGPLDVFKKLFFGHFRGL